MRKHRWFLVALVGLLILGGALTGAALAQEPTEPAPEDEGTVPAGPGPFGRGIAMGTKVGRVLGGSASMVDAVAEVTGLTADEVRAALADGQSLNDIITQNGGTVEEVVDAFIDARVAALQGSRDSLIERVQEGFPGARGMMAPFAGETLLDVIVDLTSYESAADVWAALADGTTLEEVITGGGSNVDDVVAETLARREAALDELVADGRLTQEQADAMLARMEEEIREQIEEGLAGCFDGFGLGGHRGRMPGPRGSEQGATSQQETGFQRGMRLNGTSI